MKPVPVISGKELVNALEKYDCIVVRTRGSHVRMRSSEGKMTSVPVHAGKTVPKGLLRKILYKDLEFSEEQVKQLFEML